MTDEKTNPRGVISGEAHPSSDEVLRGLRHLIGILRSSPHHAEARGQLRALAGRHEAWDELAALLEDEARAARHTEVAAAFLHELAELHLHQGRAHEADATYRRLRQVAPQALDARDETKLLLELADVYETLLDQPYEASIAVERVIELAPDEAYLRERAATLYERMGAWQKAAGAFERYAELTGDDAAARDALAHAAEIYREHGQNTPAIRILRHVVDTRPDDAASGRALDEMLERTERWAELAELRARMAELAPDRATRAALLRARARALGQAGDHAGAALALDEAARAAPEADSTLLDHAQVLTRSGRGRDAAELLRARLSITRAGTVPASEVAPLHLRLAEVLADGCDAPDEAEAVLEQLLEEVPDHVAGLALLARLLGERGDAHGEAAARLRQAQAMPAGEARVAVALEAARGLRDRAQDLGAAEQAFAQVALEAPDDDEVRAQLVDVRAAIALERVLEGAEQLFMRGQHQAAAEKLRAAIVGAHDAPAARRSRLLHRHALVKAALDELDEAHQELLEAHRLARHDLHVTLALGEICLRKKLWREAALHLSTLASHPDAPAHATEVAAGLVLAGQAEARALRPERALALYEHAVRLDPGHTGAWHALAEIAMKRGDEPLAADYLEHEAAATADARDRLRLYDALGDLALSRLDDLERAERCWRAAVDGMSLDARHVPVLEKLLEIQRHAGHDAARAETCERLALAHPEAEVRRARFDEAVDAYLAAGERARARAAAERFADAHPLDEDALWRASELALADGDYDAASARLGRTLPAWDAAESGRGSARSGSPRRAELWRRLGDARRGRGDARGAESAYARAIDVAPDSDGALAARRALVALAEVASPKIVEHLRWLVEAEQEPGEVWALARALAYQAQAGGGTAEEARALFELAAALGAPVDENDERFLVRYPTFVMASDEAYREVFDDASYHAFVDDADDAPLAETLEIVWEAAPLICPDPLTALERADLADAERVSPLAHVAAVALYPQISKALGGPTVLLYASRARHAPDVSVLLSAPPLVVLGPQVASRRARSSSDADVLGDLELRFRLGRAIELARPRRVFAAGPGAVAFARFIGGLWHAFGRGGGDPVERAIELEAERLRHQLPLLVRTRVAERLRAAAAQDLDPMRYLAACERAADRAGLLACRHVGVALAHSGGPEAARHLVQLAASPRYLHHRSKR
jgi:tetratricopeptide (TPR) repeat protein